MSSSGYPYNLIAEHDIIPMIDDLTTKYKWNGLLTNLDDLDPSEYVKTIFNVVGVAITGITGSTLVSNPITISVEESGDAYDVVAEAKYSPNVDIDITVSVGGVQQTLRLSSGVKKVSKSTGIPISEEAPAVSQATLSVQEDEVYTYSVILPEAEVTNFVAYYGVVKEGKAESGLSTSDILGQTTETITTEGTVLTFTVPARTIKNPTEEELKDNTYCLIFALPLDVYESGKYTIVDNILHLTSGFEKQNVTFDINGKTYTLLCDYSEENVFLGGYNEATVFEFEAKLTE